MIDFVMNIISCLLDSPAAKKLLGKLMGMSLVGSRYAFRHIFYRQKLVQSMLGLELGNELRKSKFLDYSLVIRNRYYENDFMKLDVRRHGKTESVVLPYKEMINYVVRPDSRITIDSKQLDDKFMMPDEILVATQDAFEVFKSERMLTTDDTTVRIQSLSCNGDGCWTCHLQRARYSDQVRTNLTLDFPLDSVVEETMRTRDLGMDRTLRPFEESVLANTIGVSAIWLMRRKKNRKGENLYFLMPRQNNTGIYNGMLGTVSGAVIAPESNGFNEDCLEDYLKEEMRREFYEESGIDNLIESGDVDPGKIRLIPLAFVRDLIRGGKPQFFFLIITDYISPKKIATAFRASFNGMMEFDDGFFTRIPRYQISPETQLNLLYALSYVQARKNLQFIDLDS